MITLTTRCQSSTETPSTGPGASVAAQLISARGVSVLERIALAAASTACRFARSVG
jgi:hypothetical protein